MTKTHFFILVAALVSSCSTNVTTFEFDTKERQDSILKTNFLGTWVIYVETENRVDALCNACPEILFLDQTATISMSDEPRDTLLYRVHSDSIVFTNMTHRPESHFIQNGSYSWTMTQKKESRELTLKHGQKKLGYSLAQ